ncbi:MAG: GAF domain-containing protein [Verrucomicrobia bacterium]|nr:GAF domain-containing protein [Verrucomicrobiota bacterium]
MDNQVQAASTPLQTLIAVELALLLDNEKRLLPAAMMLCNELQTRLSAGRASLSWVSGSSVRLLAISNMREFEKGSELAARIVGAMEECALQDEEISHPLIAGSRFVMAREHAKLAVEGKHDAVISVPLRWRDKVVAVITVERSHTEFTQEEVLALRLLGDLAVRRLYDLKQRSEFFSVSGFARN